MIEKIVLDYLSDALSVPCLMEEPTGMTGEELIVIEKTGSSCTNRIYTATLAIQSYAPSMYEAAALNEQVKEAMDNIVALPDIARCELNSDYNFTDTGMKRYRYQAVFQLTHY